MKRRLISLAALPTSGIALVAAGLLAADVEVPWSAVYPLALLVAYCAGSLVFGRRAA